jgi:hypothetical protein
MSKAKIEEFSDKIEIPYLLHFTRISNLEGILEKGLISRDAVDKLGDDVTINDEDRYDDRTNTISLSIAHPNDLMFFKYRDDDEDWCVVALYPDVLWELDCLFCKRNAADGTMIATSDDALSTIDAFRGMYDELHGLATREEQCLKAFDPTDKQAEILAFDHVPNDYIKGVFLVNRKVKKDLKEVLGDTKTLINSPNKGVYSSRIYRRKWQ